MEDQAYLFVYVANSGMGWYHASRVAMVSNTAQVSKFFKTAQFCKLHISFSFFRRGAYLGRVEMSYFEAIMFAIS